MKYNELIWVALYEDSDSLYPTPGVFHVTDYIENDSSYVRVSNKVAVSFEERDNAKVINEKIERLRAKKHAITKQFDKKIANLLALENKSEEDL